MAIEDQTSSAPSYRERYELLSAASYEGILVHVDGVVLDVNERLCALMGHPRETLLGPGTIELCVAQQDIPEIYRRMAEGIEGAYVISALRADGTRFRAELQTKQGALGDRPVRIVAVRDVDERERTWNLLRESETRFRELVEQAFDLLVISRDGVVIEVRGALDRILGLPAPEVVGRTLTDFAAPIDLPKAQRIVDERWQDYALTLLHSSGEPVPVEVAAVDATLEGLPIRVAGVRDLRPAREQERERQRLLRELERSQRLEGFGVLAGGIAHDFNNLLVGVIGNAEHLLSELEDPRYHPMLEAIVDAGQQGAALTRRMLDSTDRHASRSHEPLALDRLCAQLLALIRPSLPSTTRVELELQPGLWIEGDRVALLQVLMNLVTNGSDALQGQPGQVRITGERVTEPDERWEASLGAPVGPGDWIRIEVIDDGTGMEPGVVDRVFEPFFTTKERGYGLGLATCLGTLQGHGAVLHLQSAPSQGTRFSLLFPASPAPPGSR